MNVMEERLVKAALAALEQNANYPADIAFAKARLEEALAGAGAFVATKANASLVGKEFYVESPSFEGVAKVLGDLGNGVVVIKSDYNGAIFLVDESGLVSGGVDAE